ncbi:MAG: sigma-70 family RNA polymerase sigma factor [Candidatus Zixiibacteriota bacterium]|nr:MAG: sigma-70 family RNA polymerase sigma factor [candidate division Zixibacteria bacterium]
MKRTTEQIYDEWLVLRAQGGDKDALTELIRRWQQRMRKHVWRLTEGHNDAEDVMQDIWVVVVRKLSKLNDPATFPQWLYRIATARCADWVRKRQRDHRLHKTVSENTSTADMEDPSGSRREVLRQAMRRLPTEKQIILSLFYIEGFSTGEIAAVLQVPVGTIKSRLYHARELLKTIIERSDP